MIMRLIADNIQQSKGTDGEGVRGLLLNFQGCKGVIGLNTAVVHRESFLHAHLSLSWVSLSYQVQYPDGRRRNSHIQATYTRERDAYPRLK